MHRNISKIGKFEKIQGKLFPSLFGLKWWCALICPWIEFLRSNILSNDFQICLLKMKVAQFHCYLSIGGQTMCN